MFYNERKAHFAQFTFDLLPAIGRNFLAVSGGPLPVEPLLEAVEMDVLHCSITHARRNERVFLCVVIPKAYAAWVLYLESFLLFFAGRFE